MEFTLRYSGALPSSRHVRAKHKIRCDLGVQLAHLWQRDPRLSQVDLADIKPATKSDRFLYDVRQQEKRQVVGSAPSSRYYYHEVCGIRFVPLVTRWRFLRCELGIEVHRCAGEHYKGGLLDTQGDLDNRLKTLIDALRMPQKADELPPGTSHSHDRSHFFCLLEDDRLITKLNLEAKDSLVCSIDDRASQQRVDVDIDVRVVPVHAMHLNVEMLFP